jgi:hypothetical protein
MPPSNTELQKALRFAILWTSLNAVLLVLGLVGIVVRGTLDGAQVGLGLVGVVGAIVAVGVVRIQTLRRQLAQGGKD